MTNQTWQKKGLSEFEDIAIEMIQNETENNLSIERSSLSCRTTLRSSFIRNCCPGSNCSGQTFLILGVYNATGPCLSESLQVSIRRKMCLVDSLPQITLPRQLTQPKTGNEIGIEVQGKGTNNVCCASTVSLTQCQVFTYTILFNVDKNRKR